MFKQENALPRAKLHSAIHNWYGFTGACEDHAYAMACHQQDE